MKKTLLRWALGLFILFVLFLAIGILSLDTVARHLVQNQIHRRMGLEAKIGRLHIGILEPTVSVEKLVIYNSAEFGGAPFIELPELRVDYDRQALMAGKLHCKLLRFNLATINFVEDKQGRKNFEVLEKRLLANQNLSSATKTNHPPHPPAHTNGFAGIDVLDLTVGKATLRKLNQPGKVEEIKLNVDHQVYKALKNRDDFNGLLLLVLLKSDDDFLANGPQKWARIHGSAKKSCALISR